MKEVTVNGSRLKMLREGISLTQGQLEVKSGVSQAHISRMENNQRSTAKISTVSKLASALRVSINDLLSGEASTEPEAPIPFNELLRRAELAAPVAIPVVDQILHAGVGVTPIDYVYLPAFQARGKRLAGAAVHGDCMEPEIKDGDQVIVDFDASPNPGDVVVALVNGEEVQLRRFKARTNSHVILTCNNPAYEDCEVEDVRVIGVVIQATKILRR